jgi:hypothetical protein
LNLEAVAAGEVLRATLLLSPPGTGAVLPVILDEEGVAANRHCRPTIFLFGAHKREIVKTCG